MFIGNLMMKQKLSIIMLLIFSSLVLEGCHHADGAINRNHPMYEHRTQNYQQQQNIKKTRDRQLQQQANYRRQSVNHYHMQRQRASHRR